MHPARRASKRLLAMPIAYLFLRFGNAAHFVFAVTVELSSKEPLACASHNLQVALFVIYVIQVQMSCIDIDHVMYID